MAVAREPSPPIAMPHSITSSFLHVAGGNGGSSADGGDTESVMSDLSWDGTPDENILSGSSRTATSLAIHEEDEADPAISRYLEDGDGDHTLIMDEGVYHQLAEMEDKLKMAGEFGNALLEENQELRLLHQQIQQETSTKVEALEQERHELRMKLETAHTEKENISYDLRMEVEALRKELANQSGVLKVANSNKQGIIGELMEQKDQNQKLAGQLNEMKMERDRVHDRLKLVEKQNESISLFHHDSSLGKSEQLRAEVSVVKDENLKLRDRLVEVSSEHETMVSSLEEARERNMMLEKQLVELEQRLQFRETELRDLNRLHEETLQELGVARSRANTHCSSSLFDELETAELTGYESSEEDEEERAEMMRFHGSRGQHRQMSLAEELAESLGSLETPRMEQQQQNQSPQEQQQQQQQQQYPWDTQGAMCMDETDQNENCNPTSQPRQGTNDPSGSQEMSLAQEFADLANQSSTPRQKGEQEGSTNSRLQHQRMSLADELAEALKTSIFGEDGAGAGKMERQEEGVRCAGRSSNSPSGSAGGGNVLSLADELSQLSASMPNVKLDSSCTLVGMGVEEGTGKAHLECENTRNRFILGDEDDEDDDDEETMMVGVTMPTQSFEKGMSLADEFASMGYQREFTDDDDDEEEEEEEEEESHQSQKVALNECQERKGGEELSKRKMDVSGDCGNGKGDGGRGRESEGGGGNSLQEAEDDELEVSTLETPKASPRHIPQMADLHIKYRQIEDVLHWVHVTLTHIILELHSLVRLPLTDLGIMHASTVLHSVRPSPLQRGSSTPSPNSSWYVARAGSEPYFEEEEDGGDSDDDEYEGGVRMRVEDVGGVGRSHHQGNPGSADLIGDKVKDQLNILRSMLSIVVNGSHKMLNGDCRGSPAEERERMGQLEGQAEALERELIDTRLQVDLLEAEIERLDKMLLRKDQQIDRLQLGSSKRASQEYEDFVIQIEDEDGDGARRDRRTEQHEGSERNVGRRTPGAVPEAQSMETQRSSPVIRDTANWQTSESPTDQLTTSFSARSRSVPDFGPKNPFSYWS